MKGTALLILVIRQHSQLVGFISMPLQQNGQGIGYLNLLT